ncbi:hypothetical protein Ocin01_09493, partial [Orchesella cincta]
MKTACLLLVLIGMTSAAIQQRASPVYTPAVSSVGVSSSINTSPLKSVSSGTTPMTPAPLPSVSPQPIAQARESVASDASMIQSTAVNPSTPSQNYYVYYYPNQRDVPNGSVVGQPNSSSILSWNGWGDVAAGAGCLAMVLVGGGILYSRYGTEVKSRALRELKDLTAEDAARMARGVLRALEKFNKHE